MDTLFEWKSFNRFIINQDTISYMIYNLLITIMCISSSFFYAYLSAFGIPQEGSFNSSVDLFYILVFSVDTALRFFINDFKNDNSKSKDIKKIALNYIKDGFFFDFITTVPFIRILDGKFESFLVLTLMGH